MTIMKDRTQTAGLLEAAIKVCPVYLRGKQSKFVQGIASRIHEMSGPGVPSLAGRKCVMHEERHNALLISGNSFYRRSRWYSSPKVISGVY